ncbi:MFS transporter [Pseudomonadales bacterium]|nr:MFS transporter [Pseudomonadales bacterium]
MNSNESDAQVASETGYSKGYLRYALGMFLLIYIVNFVDRQIFSILIEPIKEEIDLSDTQLGLLGGIAFALFYTIAGIPIARWADVGVRKNIVALAILIWSGMTMMTSTAKSFGGLLLARVGVGIGEAGCSPPIHSMISDYFPENKRATALAIYAMGIPIGGAIGTLAGGWIGEYYGWRLAFLLVGCPGIILSLVVYLTIREPVRGLHRPIAQQKVPEVQIPLKETIRFMWGLRSFRHLSFAGSLHAFVGYGVALFMPSFFMRIHGYGLAETSSYLFLIGLTGVIGTFLGGLFG